MKPMQIIKNGFKIALHNKRIVLFYLFSTAVILFFEFLSMGFFTLADNVHGIFILPGVICALLTFLASVFIVYPLMLGTVYTQSRAVDRLVDPQASYRFKDIFRYLNGKRYKRGLFPLVFNFMQGAAAGILGFIMYIGILIVVLIFGSVFYNSVYEIAAYYRHYGYVPDAVLTQMITPQLILAILFILAIFLLFIMIINTFLTYLYNMANAVTAMEDSLKFGEILRTTFYCYRKGFKKHLTIGITGSLIMAALTIAYLLFAFIPLFLPSAAAAVLIVISATVFAVLLILVQLGMQFSTILLLKQQRENEPAAFMPAPPIMPFYPQGNPYQQVSPTFYGNGQMPSSPPPHMANPPQMPPYNQGGYNPPPIVPPAPSVQNQPAENPAENPPIQEVPVEPAEQPSSPLSDDDFLDKAMKDHKDDDASDDTTI